MISTLKEARKWEKQNPGEIKILKYVRYYAELRGCRYELLHDWTLDEIERSIWLKENDNKRRRKK